MRLIRESLGLTQRELANKLGYPTAQFISNIEREVSPMPLIVARKLIRMGADRASVEDAYLRDFEWDMKRSLR